MYVPKIKPRSSGEVIISCNTTSDHVHPGYCTLEEIPDMCRSHPASSGFFPPYVIPEVNEQSFDTSLSSSGSSESEVPSFRLDKISTNDQALQTSEKPKSGGSPKVLNDAPTSMTKPVDAVKVLKSSVSKSNKEKEKQIEKGSQRDADLKKVRILQPEKVSSGKKARKDKEEISTKSVIKSSQDEKPKSPKTRSVRFSKHMPKVEPRNIPVLHKQDTFLSVGEDLKRKLRHSYGFRDPEDYHVSRPKRRRRARGSPPKPTFVVRGLNQWSYNRRRTLSQIDLTRLSKPMQDILKRSTPVKEFALRMERLNRLNKGLERYSSKDESGRPRKPKGFREVLEAEKRKVGKSNIMGGDVTLSSNSSTPKQQKLSNSGSDGKLRRGSQGDMAEFKRMENEDSPRGPSEQVPRIKVCQHTSKTRRRVCRQSTTSRVVSAYPRFEDIPEDERFIRERQVVEVSKSTSKFQLSSSPIFTSIGPLELVNLEESPRDEPDVDRHEPGMGNWVSGEIYGMPQVVESFHEITERIDFLPNIYEEPELQHQQEDPMEDSSDDDEDFATERSGSQTQRYSDDYQNLGDFRDQTEPNANESFESEAHEVSEKSRSDDVEPRTRVIGKRKKSTLSRQKHEHGSSGVPNLSNSDGRVSRMPQRVESRISFDVNRDVSGSGSSSFNDRTQETSVSDHMTASLSMNKKSTSRVESRTKILEAAIDCTPESSTSSKRCNYDSNDHANTVFIRDEEREICNLSPIVITNCADEDMQLSEFVAKARKALRELGPVKDPNQRFIEFKIDLHSLQERGSV